MSVLIGIALKSLIISGLALGLLKLMSHRSAAENRTRNPWRLSPHLSAGGDSRDSG